METLWAAVEASAAGRHVRSDVWLYPIANVAHVLGLMVFFSAVAVTDLRLLGAFRGVPVLAVLRPGRLTAVLALLLMATSGSVLFVADAVAIAGNPAFLVKMLLLAIGLGNVLTLELLTRQLPAHTLQPSAVMRACALVSLGVWLAVATLGRLIAYV